MEEDLYKSIIYTEMKPRLTKSDVKLGMDVPAYRYLRTCVV